MAQPDIPSRVCFPYYLTRDIKLDLKVKVNRAEGLIPRPLTVSAVVKSARRALHRCSKDTSLPTSVFPFVSWDEWLVFPVRYSDLATDAEIEFTFRDQGFEPVYKATLELFKNGHLALKTGVQRVRIHSTAAHTQRRLRKTAAAQDAAEDDDSGDSDIDDAVDVDETAAAVDAQTDVFRIEKLRERQGASNARTFRMPWLDRLLQERVEVGGIASL